MGPQHPCRLAQALAAAVIFFLAGCAGAGLFPGRGDTGPSFRDAHMTVQDAQAALVPGRSTQADVRTALGPAHEIAFDSGHSVWLYRVPGPGAGTTEFVVLFSPSGVLKKARVATFPR